jgi:1-acyl-sn-glycerol-3-phosphate acyltransferase
MRLLIQPEVYERVRRLELPFNRYGLDPYGISQEDLAVFFTALGVLYKRYFDVRVSGLENVPEAGRCMLVGNHSGGYAVDGAMVLASTFFDKDPPRLTQGMAEKFLGRWPFASKWLSRIGQFTGLPEHAERLLEDDRLLMVFPEGARGTAKLYHERNSLVRFGTGFVRLAMKTKTPIVPFAFIGGGDAVPTVRNSELLGRLVGAPYVPITPYVIAVPLPVGLQLYYGEPIRVEGNGNEEDEIILAHVETIKAKIASLIDDGVERRRQGTIPDRLHSLTSEDE